MARSDDSPATGNTAGNPREEEIARIFSECLDRVNAGELLDLETVVAAHPELAPDLRDALEVIAEFYSPRAEGISSESPESWNLTPGGEPERFGRGKLLRKLGDYRLLREIGRGGMGIPTCQYE